MNTEEIMEAEWWISEGYRRYEPECFAIYAGETMLIGAIYDKEAAKQIVADHNKRISPISEELQLADRLEQEMQGEALNCGGTEECKHCGADIICNS